MPATHPFEHKTDPLQMGRLSNLRSRGCYVACSCLVFVVLCVCIIEDISLVHSQVLSIHIDLGLIPLWIRLRLFRYGKGDFTVIVSLSKSVSQ